MALFSQISNTEAKTLRINEFMASNGDGLLDEDGDSSDWIEIWNYGDRRVSLQGWTLTDDPETPDLWAFPAIHLEANAYLILFASGKDRRDAGGELHCNFELDRNGENLSLRRFNLARWEIISEISPYPSQRRNVSYGVLGNETSNAKAFFLTPTPGERNRGESVEGFVRDTRFSVDRGYYEDPFDLVISTETPEATFSYTLDGSLPTESHGTLIQPNSPEGPTTFQLRITDSTLIRVMAFKPGFLPTNVDTQSYFFPASLLNQNGQGSPFNQSVRWGHAGQDWEMDPVILNHRDSDIRPVKEDFLRLPTLSIAMNFEEMFGQGGIYIAGQSVEKRVSAEWINPEAAPHAPNEVNGFQTDGTIQIVGGSSPQRWKSDKLSMRLKFDQDLNYPVFGEEATDRFDTLVIDARLNNVWHYGGGVEPVGQRNRAQYVRDQYAANLHNAMGGTSPHGKHAHVMLNGIYWGIHTIHERPDDNFAASYLGGANEDYDSIKHRPNDVLQGSSRNYNELHSMAGRDLSIQENYDAVRAILDIDDFIDYMLMNYYIGNGDWAHHNWYASFNRVSPDGKWRFHSWDAEKGLHGVNNNVTGRNDRGGPTFLHHQLIRNESYRYQFADRAYDQLRYGVLSPVTAARLYREISDPIDLPIRLESARWGDNQRSQPYTRLDWVENRDSLFGLAQNRQLPTHDFFNRRSEIVINQFNARNWLPSMEPPVFNQHGGHITGDFGIQIESNERGDILYTLDGSDPMPVIQTGNQTVTHLVPESHEKRAFMPTNNSLAASWMQSDFNDQAWPKGNLGAGYDNNSTYEDLISSDLDFQNSVNRNDTESIYMRVEFEIENLSSFDRLELGMRYDDGFVAYLNGTEIVRANAPGSAGSLVAWNASASSSHSDNEAVIFQAFDVSSAVEHLRTGKNVLAVHGLNVNATSSDFLIWPTLTAVSIEEDPDAPTNQQAIPYTGPIQLSDSTTIKARTRNGSTWSPLLSAHFIVDTIPVTSDNLVLSAIHYHPSAPSDSETTAGFQNRRDFEFLALENISSQTLDLRGLRFTAGIDFEFVASNPLNELAPGETLVLVSNPNAFESRYGTEWKIAGTFQNGTNLNNGGERIAAINASGQTVLNVTYSDESPWPAEADGLGSYLSQVQPQGMQNPNLPASWRAMPESGIQPTTGVAELFQNWLAEFYTAVELNDPLFSGWTADPDGDEKNNLLEFFHGSNPAKNEVSLHWLNIETEVTNSDWQISFAKVRDLPGIEWTIETSPDLLRWIPLPVITPKPVDHLDHYQWTQSENRQNNFYRLVLRIAE